MSFQAAVFLTRNMSRKTSIAAQQVAPRLHRAISVANFTTNGYNHDGPQGMHVTPHEPVGADRTNSNDAPHGKRKGPPSQSITNGGASETPQPTGGQPQTAPVSGISNQTTSSSTFTDGNHNKLTPSGLVQSASPNGKVESNKEHWQQVQRERSAARTNRNLSYPQMEHRHPFSTTSRTSLSDMNHDAVTFTRDKSHWEEFKDEYMKMFEQTKSKMERDVQEAQEQTQNKLQDAMEYTAETTHNLSELGDALQEDLTAKVNTAQHKIDASLKDTKDYIVDTKDDVKDLGVAVKDDVTDKATTANHQVKETLEETKNYTLESKDDLKELGKAVKDDLMENTACMQNKAKETIDESKDYVAETIDDVKKLGEAVKDNVQQTDIASEAKSMAMTAKDRIESTSQDVLGSKRVPNGNKNSSDSATKN